MWKEEVHFDVTQNREVFSYFTVVSRCLHVLSQNLIAALCRLPS